MDHDAALADASFFRRVLTVVLIAFAPTLSAGPIFPDIWYEFGFSDPGVSATGCDPADPAGNFCVPSSGTLTEFLDAPAWTFSSVAGATLTVTDAFLSTDRFELFDFGTSLGLTSLPDAAALLDCGDDPLPCLATAGMSSGVFVLARGSHAITLVPVLGDGGGAGYLKLVGAAPVPEPATLVLISLGVVLFAAQHRRRHGSWNAEPCGPSLEP